MDFMTALDIGASGLKAQRATLNVISMNMANMRTTKTLEGGPYQRKSVSFESTPVYSPFDEAMNNQLNRELHGVKVLGVTADERPFKQVYEPHHPDANDLGYVYYPDINVVEEMTNMMNATRGYEANVQTIESVKQMFNKALQIGV
ncbi:MAG: flagellar basal body rod protein FlgC [Pseudodesulfovibrio sp.]|uniref:Flagellar basal-body rod protein FlgC n=1 Tax=Pseudodesulfovibrio aespoeensis (strain ATCC 700646 / DSM 10631 / Aspo-2) TaxID=643562 RepID=E6VRI1_PSEA9|nr:MULTISPECIES: flagellar basal body rod protein FlgC [Pseudodesulfovibrio]MBU4475877.1 flagellar basal body rod protein FlgC [Pseudomonadota bacterium]ADU63018.1 flagellar basal-body rod protein FlgC [Pseudodesulfovibrio aespoeensis Aspo-2]MBU4516715.1 flagellar basal body rod protein FlgC [Pseudomonadota bacterium]MBU4522672.1 flagellar basal body rod protein FlgC [Pseudomonadota bacterium]MBU4558820.1 flagellar basal body rod protein FlgC [Pseudomonadota bacterium]